jgi:hypothetical protein
MLLPVFDVLALAGLDSEKWTSQDDAASYSRVFTYQISKESLMDCYISITGSLPGDTDECRRVIVGYTSPQARTFHPDAQPIYKLECKE